MSFASIKTEGIVLSSAPSREADRIYRVCTKDYGKLSVQGRGALKAGAKLASHLESIGRVKLEVVRGRHSTTVIGVEFMELYPLLRADIERRLTAQTALALLNRYVDDEEHDPVLYELLVNWLRYLNDTPEFTPAQLLLSLTSFVYKLMDHLGYQVQLRQCLSCANTILPFAFRWHGGKGGLVCTGCAQRDSREWFAAVRVPEEVISLMHILTEDAYTDVLRLSLTKPVIESLARMAHDFMMSHLPGRERAPFWEGLLIHIDLERPTHSL